MLIAAYNNEAVTFTTNATGTSVIRLAAPQAAPYIIFDDLTLDAQGTADSYGLTLSSASNIRFSRGTIKNATNYCVYTPNSTNIEVLQSRITNCVDGFNMGNTSGALIANNLVYDHSSRGIAVRPGSTNVQVLFNSVTGMTGVGDRGLNIVSGAANTTMRNNISFGNATDILDETGGTVGNIVSDNLTANPFWVNATTPTWDFHLTYNSTGALDQGVTMAAVSTDYEGTIRGNPPDKGAYECSTACIGPPVPPSVSTPLPAPPHITHFLAR